MCLCVRGLGHTCRLQHLGEFAACRRLQLSLRLPRGGSEGEGERRHGEGEVELVCTHPALRTAPVQLKEDAAVPVAFALYGDAMTLSPSSSSDTAVVRLIRSSSEICKMQTLQRRID